MNYQLVPLTMDTCPPVQDLARLHQVLLPNSPVVLLGQRFMTHFYYPYLIRDGLIYGAIAYVDQKPAGFIMATHDSAGFMGQAIRRHGWFLAGLLLYSLIVDPKRIAALWEAWQIMSHRESPNPQLGEGELLSFGVLPDYLSPRFIRQSQVRLAHDLINIALEQLQQKGVTLVRALVDQDNTSAKFFYHGLGWTLNPGLIPGWRIPTVEFIWRSHPLPPANSPTPSQTPHKTPSRPHRLFYWLLGATITLALLFWALRGIQVLNVWQAIQQSHPLWMILAIITFLASFSLRARRWGTLLGARQNPGSFQLRQTAVFIGFAGNCVLPAHGGEMIRSLILKRFGGIPFAVAVGSIFTERLLDAVVAFILLFLSLFILTQSGIQGLENVPVGGIAIALLCLASAFFAAAWYPHLILSTIKPLTTRLGLGHWTDSLIHAVQAILEGLEALRSPQRTLLALVETFGIWGCTALTYWSLLQAFEITAPGIIGAILVQGLVALAIALPSSPGYLGPFEAAIRFGLQLYVIPPDTIIAYALVLRVLMYLSLMTVALILALRLGLSWRDFSQFNAPIQSPQLDQTQN